MNPGAREFVPAATLFDAWSCLSGEAGAVFGRYSLSPGFWSLRNFPSYPARNWGWSLLKVVVEGIVVHFPVPCWIGGI